MTDILESLDLFEVDDSLTHYGVLGMKWGIRKDLKSFGRKKESDSANKDPRSGIKKGYKNRNVIQPNKTDTGLVIRKQRGTSLKKLSDADLNRTLDRLRKEQEYQRLNQAKIHRYITEIDKTVTKKVINKQVGELTGTLANVAIDNLIKKTIKNKVA